MSIWAMGNGEHDWGRNPFESSFFLPIYAHHCLLPIAFCPVYSHSIVDGGFDEMS
jgi:hypothetical protein